MTPLQTDIERRLADSEPDIEVLLAEVSRRSLPARVHRPSRRRHARDVRARDGAAERPARALLAGGLIARQRAPADQARPLPPLRRAAAHACARVTPADRAAHGGRAAPSVRSFTGELVGASEEEVTLAADGGVIAIPYSEIRRSNLIEE